MKSAVNLRVDLQQAIREFPQAKHVVITHSHGGNVALYALKDRELLSRISGVVTLATPFIQITQRSHEWLVLMTMIGVFANIAFWPVIQSIRIALMGVMPAFGLVESPSTSVFESAMRFGGRIFLTIVVGGAGIGLGAKLAEWILRGSKYWLRKQQRRAVRCYPRLTFPGLRILNLQVPRDEAGLVLRSVSFLSDTLLNLHFHPLVIIAAFIISVIGFGSAALAINAKAGYPSVIALVGEGLFVLCCSWLSVMVTLVLYAPLVTLLQTLVRGHVAGFGIERFSVNIAFRVQSVSQPKMRGATISEPYIKYREWRAAHGSWRDIRHCSIYRIPEVAEFVGQFIKDLPDTEARTFDWPAFSKLKEMQRLNAAFRPTLTDLGIGAAVIAAIVVPLVLQLA
jgi:hypothetical protein